MLVLEIVLLLLLSVVAFVKYLTGHAPKGHSSFSWSWLNPSHFASPSVFMAGMLLMVFVYWGWDTTVSVNEETADADRIPGTAGVLSTVILLATYFMVILSIQLFAGFGSTGIGLDNTANQNDVLSPPRVRDLRRRGDRDGAGPAADLDGHVLVRRHRDDHDPAERPDHPVLSSARTFWLCGVFPFLSGVMLFVILGWSVYFYTDPDQSYTSWHMPFWPHATIGGVLSIGIVTALIGLAWMLSLQRKYREFFSGESMRQGISFTDDDEVVAISAAD